MGQNYGNIFLVKFQKILPVIIIDEGHDVASLKPQEPLSFIEIQFPEEVHFFKHIAKNNII